MLIRRLSLAFKKPSSRPTRSADGIMLGCLLLGTEVLGRQARSDLIDLLLLTALSVIGALWLMRNPAAVEGLRQIAIKMRARLRSKIRAHWFRIGIDLRGDPPLPRGMPSVLVAAPLVLGAVILLRLPGVLPAWDLRVIGTDVAYLPFLLALGLQWALAAAVVVSIPIAMRFVAAGFVRHLHEEGRKVPFLLDEFVERPRLLIKVCVGLAFVAALLPSWIPLFTMLGALAWQLFVLARMAHLSLDFVWRRRSGSPALSLSWRNLKLTESIGITLGVLAVTALLSPGLLLPWIPQPSVFSLQWPISTFLASLVLWFGGLTHAGAMIGSTRFVQRESMRDPARPILPRVWFDPAGLTASSALQKSLIERGIELRSDPGPRTRRDVPLVCEGFPAPRDPFAPTAWPLSVEAAAPLADADQRLIEGRDRLQRRRKIRSGFERLFKSVSATRGLPGMGVWLGPHLWVMGGMSRDPMDPHRVGPPYRTVFPLSARSHLHAVLGSADVDLIFVEDGIRWRSFRQVLDALFEHHDIHGSERPIEERAFVHIPRVRVLIHSHEVGDDTARAGEGHYPEPDYDDLGRAKILHVFKNREGEPERPEVPMDQVDLQLPSMAL